MNKLIAWLKSWLKKQIPTPIPIPTPDPVKPTGCGCDLSLPLCDPNPAKYTQAYMDAYGSYEECGIEAQKKIICRWCCIRGNSGGFWMLSSLGMDHVQRGNPCVASCFSQDGYRYHIKGYLASEPQGNAIKTLPVLPQGKYVVVECRKEIK